MSRGKDMENASDVEYWSWESCCTKIRGLKGRLGFEDSDNLRFLKLSLSLKDGSISDELIIGRKLHPYEIKGIYCILYGYAGSNPVQETSELISFRKIPGGWFYHKPFTYRVLKSIERTFGSDPSLLIRAGELLGGSEAEYGDYSVRIYSLPLIPLTVVLWAETEEFPASANILYDSSITNYLSTEQIVMLSELTALRLRHAIEVIKRG
ncbi:MAG: hypothetical protein DRN92_04080 [Thermoproteota archaeon]|nr:MAG: hypothetical protein DRN92_04080 [Candidatus Korarchaeota archaeon]